MGEQVEGGLEQSPAGRLEPAAAHVSRRHRRVEAAAVGLDRPHGGDPGGDACRGFAGAALKLSEGDRRHADDQVEAARALDSAIPPIAVSRLPAGARRD